MKLKINKNMIKKIYTCIIVILVYLFGILVAFNSKNLSNKLNIKLMPIFLFALFIWLAFPVLKISIISNLRDVFLLFCTLTFFISIANFEGYRFISSVLAIVIYMILERSFLKIDKKYFYIGLCISVILASIISIKRFSIETYNSQGIIYSFMGIMSLNLLVFKKNKSMLLYSLIIFITISILVLTRSRTSIMGFLFAALVTFMEISYKDKSIRKIISAMVILTIIIVFFKQIQQLFINIFFNKWGNSDITSNRLEIWKYIWNYKNITGHSYNQIDAHNTFFQLMWNEGFVIFIAFIIFIIMIFIEISKTKNKIIYLNFFGGWLLISLFENLDIFSTRMIPVTLLYFIHLVYLILESNNRNRIY